MDVVEIVVGQDVGVREVDGGWRVEFEQAGAERLVLQGRHALVEWECGEFAPGRGAVEGCAVVEAEQAADAPGTGLRAKLGALGVLFREADGPPLEVRTAITLGEAEGDAT